MIARLIFVKIYTRGSTDAILIARQLQKYITAKKLLYFVFADLEKVFDRVSYGEP